MNADSIKQIIFLTRPWQVYFHIELARRLRESLKAI